MVEANFNKEILKFWNKWQGYLDCEMTQKCWCAGELVDLSKKIASDLAAREIQCGDIVGIVLGNTVAFPVIIMAFLILEANIVLLHESITDAELNSLRKQIDLKWIAHDFVAGLSRINRSNYKNQICYTIKNLEIYLLQFKDFKNKNDNLSGYRGIVIQPSSGTCGQPKLCIRDQRAVMAEAINHVKTIQIYPNIRIRVTTGLNHAYAFGFGLMSTLVANSTLVLAQLFNPKKILREETEKTSDILTIVPTMMPSLMHFKETNSSYILPKTIFTSGVSCNAQMAEKFTKIFGCNLYVNYGTTETGVISTTSYDRMLGGVGKPFYGVDVRLRNEEKYASLVEDVGDICVKSTSMMVGYVDDIIDHIDYFMTGDIGYFDEQQNLHLIGRKCDIININGFKVNSIKVEEIILQYSGVKDCAVYPGKTKTGVEIVLAAVQGLKETDLLDLRKYCYTKLNINMIPRKFYFLDVIPRTASGKCRKADLPGYQSALN